MTFDQWGVHRNRCTCISVRPVGEPGLTHNAIVRKDSVLGFANNFTNVTLSRIVARHKT
jgi:hypothetical protein